MRINAYIVFLVVLVINVWCKRVCTALYPRTHVSRAKACEISGAGPVCTIAAADADEHNKRSLTHVHGISH